ncbi:hypothetical protein BD414DRAFT_527118 [Trametes punicea]|nr:hypothetical protein BD414DRAFT_527118 [Trametes punicea]
MALTATVLLASFAVFDVLAVPLAADNSTDVSFMFSSGVPSTYASDTILTASSSFAVLGPSAAATVPTLVSEFTTAALDSVSASPTDSQELAPSVTDSATSSSSTDPTTTTVITTDYEAPPTVTVTAPPQTVTDTITIVPPPAPSPTVEQTAWSAPPQMTDLSAFNIKNIAFGQQNMRIIVGTPLPPPQNASNGTTEYATEALSEAQIAIASAVSAGLIPPPPAPTPDATANGSAASEAQSFLQLFYPANSINPAQEPQGGADFYATPLDLSAARNVSLAYSVFFPADFDFVEAGKLPGIYGGHEGCSGGDDALECFSTRLMWREKGLGELYLYAPKDKQTDALCATPPRSVCDADYGLSIGRGAFAFAPGNWTHVRQTVTLNTPGMQDGGFALDVNGVRVIERCDVYYRGVPRAPDPEAESAVVPGPVGAETDSGSSSLEAGDQDGFIDTGGLFHVKIDSVLAADGAKAKAVRDFTPAFAPYPELSPESILRGDADTFTPAFAPPSAFAPAPAPDVKVADPVSSSGGAATSTMTVTSTTTVVPTPQTVTVYPTSTATAYVMAIASDVPLGAEAVASPTPIGFTGLFFSTFFGGHEPKYASPKDQFTWFKDFSMTINA